MHNEFKQHRWSLESSKAGVGARIFMQWLYSPGSDTMVQVLLGL